MQGFIYSWIRFGCGGEHTPAWWCRLSGENNEC